MNLTIPIMAGQTAQITILDGKTNETRVWMADHQRVTCMKVSATTAQIEYYYQSAIPNESVLVKGIGRNKRRCPKSLKLEVK